MSEAVWANDNTNQVLVVQNSNNPNALQRINNTPTATAAVVSTATRSAASGGKKGAVTIATPSMVYGNALPREETVLDSRQMAARLADDHTPQRRSAYRNDSAGNTPQSSRGGAVGMLIAVSRDLILDEPTPSSQRWWRPNEDQGASKREKGLLETLHMRRQTSNTAYISLASRPEEELFRNFTDPDGFHIDLTFPCFIYSKSALALRNLYCAPDDAMLRGKDVKDGLMQQLPELQEDEHYLLRYRDYSMYAIRSCADRSLIKTEGGGGYFFSTRFVELCFVLCVGATEGVFVPITEAQLCYGWELVRSRSISASAISEKNRIRGGEGGGGQGAADRKLKSYSLTKDQFNLLIEMGKKSNNNADNSADGVPAPASPTGGTTPAYATQTKPALSPWDWTPSGIQRRWNDFLDRQFQTLGRMVFKLLAIGALGYLGYCFYLRAIYGPTMKPPQDPYAMSSAKGGRRGGKGASARRGGRQNDGDDAERQPGVNFFRAASLVGSVVGSGVRSLFDAVLVPTDYDDGE